MSRRPRPGESASPARSGAAMMLILLMLPVIIGMVAFSIDIGLITLLRAQIQNSVDSGALAASLMLQEDADALEEAAAEAERFIQLNRVGSAVTVPADAIKVEIGRWDPKSQTFNVNDPVPNGVRVFALQDNEPFFFGRFFGRQTFGAPASAIASGAAYPIDIMMVLDLSGSMASQGRIEALWNAAPTFVDVIEEFGDDEDRIGVMGLSANPDDYDPVEEGHTGTLYMSGLHSTDDHHVGVLENELTENFDHLRSNVLISANMQARKYGGWTGTGAAIGDAAHYLTYGPDVRDSEDVKKVIVLMSDGYANKPRWRGRRYSRSMARYAATRDIRIYTISLGDNADRRLMRDIASITNGIHFDATGSGEATLTRRLKEAFRHTAAQIKRNQLVR